MANQPQKATKATNQRKKAVSTKSTKFDHTQYNAVVESAELMDIRLISSSFDMSVSLPGLLRRQREAGESLIRWLYESELSEYAYSDDDGFLFGQFSWKTVGKESRKHVVSVKATYIVVYQLAPGLSGHYVGIFLKKVGRFATYPYFRTLVATLHADARLDVPPLPVLK